MNSIGILIYSYQNKNLINTIKEIIDKSSRNNILYFYIIDQNNIDRTRSIDIDELNINIKYRYIKWDSIISPIVYKQDGLRSLKTKYYMQISDDVLLIQNWDTEFINFLNKKTNTILSGFGTTEPYIKNNFFIKLNIKNSDKFESTKFINRDFIFGLTEDILKIGYPTQLKYYGEEEQMSINTKNINLQIYSIPSDYIINNSIPLDNEQYLPFSITHNYNKFLINNNIKEYYGLDIPLLPYEDNDVLYDVQKSQIDKMGGLRYINKIKEVR